MTVKTKISRALIALLVAASLLIAGTAQAGYSEPGVGRVVVGGR
jgi:hypothetical protein